MEARTHPQYADRDGSETSELSNAMVRLHKELFGRGPTKARTGYAAPDTVVTSLENTFTPAERSMSELGDHLRVEETRLFFQRACRDKFIAVVEQITGRKVRAFTSGTDSENDVVTEVFYLEPADGSDPRADGSGPRQERQRTS